MQMKLIGNVKSIINDEFVEKCTEYAKVFNPNGRTFEMVLDHTIGGEAVERLVCAHMGLTQTGFETMEYDAVDKSGLRYEIKHSVKDTKWWTFNPKAYKFFLENAHEIDHIIWCYYDKKTGNVYLKAQANAPSFRRYASPSKFNDSWYYNTMQAKSNGECHIY